MSTFNKLMQLSALYTVLFSCVLLMKDFQPSSNLQSQCHFSELYFKFSLIFIVLCTAYYESRMNIFRVLDKISWIAASRPVKSPPVRCYSDIYPSASVIGTKKDAVLTIKKKLPRKLLTPILREELDMTGYEITHFYKSGGYDLLDKALLQERLTHLKRMGFNKEDIKPESSILLIPSKEVAVRKEILEECGLKEITLKLLSRYEAVTATRVGLLKVGGFIPHEVNVPKHILSFSGEDISPPDFSTPRKHRYLRAADVTDYLPLAYLHRYTVLHYLAYCTECRNLLAFKQYVKGKSLRYARRAFETLLSLNVKREQLAASPRLFNCDADELKDLLDAYPTIGGRDMFEIIKEYPRVALLTQSDVDRTLDCFRDFGIAEENIAAWPNYLTLGNDTLRQGLSFLKSIPDLWALRHSNQVLHLTVQTYVMVKLQYLRSKRREVIPSSYVLACAKGDMKRILTRKKQKDHILDFLRFLAVELEEDAAQIKAMISRHAKWRQGSTAVISETLSYLRCQGFKNDAIRENVQILLYPRSYVEGVVRRRLGDVATGSSRSHTTLALCLYDIEREHDFTGEGVLEEAHGSELAQHIKACTEGTCRRNCTTNPDCAFRLNNQLLQNVTKEQEVNGS